MARRESEETERSILGRVRKHGVKTVETKPGAPAAPAVGTSAWLDYLDEWAVKIVLAHPEAPAILREGDRFILDRPERKRTRYTGIRKVFAKLMVEIAQKDAVVNDARGTHPKRFRG